MELMDAMKKTGKAVEQIFVPSPDDNGDMDILARLKQEHEEVLDLLDQLVKSESAPARKAFLKKIRLALVPHVRAEERVVYNALIARRGKDSKVDGHEGYLEHSLADKMLATLGRISNAASPEFTAGAKVLKEIVEHHVEEEERNVWKDVREHFDEDERLEMDRKFEAMKKKVHVV